MGGARACDHSRKPLAFPEKRLLNHSNDEFPTFDSPSSGVFNLFYHLRRTFASLSDSP